MANYDRYWDLHITGITGWYYFAPQIDEQMFYQVSRPTLGNCQPAGS